MRLTKENGFYKVVTRNEVKFTGSLARATTFLGYKQ